MFDTQHVGAASTVNIRIQPPRQFTLS